MSTTIQYSDQLVVITCGDCAIPFALPKDFQARKYADGSSFWCPNGHEISYSEPETARLKRQLKSAQARVTHAEDQREAAERSARAYKGVATRVKRQAAHGVCPAPGCHRTFANLARHMTGQHPDFVAEHPVTGGES